MIPQKIVRYLMDNHIPFKRHWHPRAVAAQVLAHRLHVSGYHVAKTVVVEADDEKVWLAVVPAAELVDVNMVARAIGAQSAWLASEARFATLFPDCELGAEPPFGGMFDLGVVMDERLAGDQTLVLRAGSHEETLEMRAVDFCALESPIVAPIARRYTHFRTEAFIA